MKFWELITAFETEKEILDTVFEKTEWKVFKDDYQNFDKVTNQQNRKILDKKMPFQLSKEVCKMSKQNFFLYYEETPQSLTTWKKESKEAFEMITPLDILLRYGGEYIEKTIEKSISKVRPKIIGNNIEVLGVFSIINKDILATL